MNRCLHQELNSYQLLIGVWMGQFIQGCRQADFKLSKCLVKLAKSNEKRIDEHSEGAPLLMDYLNKLMA